MVVKEWLAEDFSLKIDQSTNLNMTELTTYQQTLEILVETVETVDTIDIIVIWYFFHSNLVANL